MKKIILIITYYSSFIICLLTIGCYTTHKKFTNFSFPKEDLNTFNIKTTGIYYLNGEPFERCVPFVYLFLYTNGLTYIHSSGGHNRYLVETEFGYDKNRPWLIRSIEPYMHIYDSVFWSNPYQNVNNIFNNNVYKNNKGIKEWWGAYKINGNKIKIQYFTRTDQESIIFKRYMIELNGYFENDSTLLITDRNCGRWFHCYQCEYNKKQNPQSYLPKVKYKFFPINIKPDSSQAWFLKKHWYNKGLHESRK